MTRSLKTLGASLVVVALAVSGRSTPALAVPVFATATPSLEYGNGNKIVVGPYGTLHAVAKMDDQIVYRTSADGAAWSGVTVLSGTMIGSSPSIAVDRSGGIGVVWVANPNANGIGSLYYSYKAMGVAGSSWAHRVLPATGKEPSIASSSSGVFLSWTTGRKVQLTSFPTLSPPSTPVIQEVDSSLCHQSGFRMPSVTVTVSPDPCAPAVRVAYLYYSDEQDTGCGDWSTTKVGPMVRQRNPLTGAWDLVFSDLTTSGLFGSVVEPVSLSMSTRYYTGETFLAWSDAKDGIGRTRLAHVTTAGVWETATASGDRRRVHVRAPREGNPVGRFRLAYAPVVSPNAQALWSTGSWLSGALAFGPWSVAFTAPAPWPQALFWSSASVSGGPKKAQVYSETFGSPPTAGVWAALDVGPAAGLSLAEPAIALAPCSQTVGVATIAAGGRAPGTAVDVSDLGTLVSVAGSSAQVRTFDRRTAWVTWSAGRLVSYSDDSLVVDAPRSAVTVAGDGFSVRVMDGGHLAAYDNVTIP